MSGSFDSQVVAITGAARGIGRSTALEFVRRGATIVAVDRDSAGLEILESQLIDIGAKSLALTIDLEDIPQVRVAAQTILDKFGKIDVLVNNAGWDRAVPFLQSSEATWHKVIAINLMAPIALCHAVLPGMIERSSGKVVNLGSDAGRVGSSGEAVYSAAKGGVIAFTKALAREVARYGISVNCVSPGPTDTPFLAEVAQQKPGLIEAIKKSIPMRRLGSAQDVVGAIVFLASDEASFITGQTLSVSGGLTMV